ncbi:MAG: FAD-dependent thymidylate synthase [Eubacterium sp.]|nr:FAD-dependent thymidylate synthase [Eubacterium sp.]
MERVTMGNVTIQEYTTKKPITMIGREAGVCYGSDITDDEKCYKRGINCLLSHHGRTWEFPDVYMILDGYSARVIREWYTHLGGMPTRLQSSTRYIDYEHGFDFILPPQIEKNEEAKKIYLDTMGQVAESLRVLDDMGIAREDSANLLPLGMTTKIVCKHNFRNLVDMSHQRMCTRAYWEYRQLFSDLLEALKAYSPEWEYLVNEYFKPKCELGGFCTEARSCGRRPKKDE